MQLNTNLTDRPVAVHENNNGLYKMSINICNIPSTVTVAFVIFINLFTYLLK